MNTIEQKLLRLLRTLHDDYDAPAVKAEFEAEGSRPEELLRLTELVFRADMDLTIKIGGCEAFSDLKHAAVFGARNIMAPMIETPFAMKKFRTMATKFVGELNWLINIETKTARQNLDDILSAGDGFISGIVVGRTDLSNSMALPKTEINGAYMLSAVKDIAARAKRRNLTVGVGGNINLATINFLRELSTLVDYFETRKIVFNFRDDAPKFLADAIKLAVEFEMLYLENKFNLYNAAAREDSERLTVLKSRI